MKYGLTGSKDNNVMRLGVQRKVNTMNTNLASMQTATLTLYGVKTQRYRRRIVRFQPYCRFAGSNQRVEPYAKSPILQSNISTPVVEFYGPQNQQRLGTTALGSICL